MPLIPAFVKSMQKYFTCLKNGFMIKLKSNKVIIFAIQTVFPNTIRKKTFR